MAGRAIWKGHIHFRAIDVPVKLHTAIKEERIQFHLLHKRDHAKLKQQMFCAYEQVPVPPEEQIRGYELEEGKYIIVDPEELEQVEPEDSRIIEVSEFVRTKEIDPVFLGRAYYLEPELQQKNYNILAAALVEMDMAGICSWTVRKRSYVGVLQSSAYMLRLHTMRYADEVISPESLDLPDIPLSEKELKIGIDLINQMSGPFQPRKFKNDHQIKLQELIDKKIRGDKIAIFRPRRLKPTSPDKLFETLKASLKKVA